MHNFSGMGPAPSGKTAPHPGNCQQQQTREDAPAAQAHIVRAMLEAMCFQTREVVDAMCHDAGLERLEVRREPTVSV